MVMPNLRYENLVWKRGYKEVAGLDEAGRGAFAGPLVTGCVVFPKDIDIKKLPKEIRIDDSKVLSGLQRSRSYKWIIENAKGWGIGVSSVAEINKIRIVKSTASAFRRCVKGTQLRMHTRVEYLLIDAFYIPYIRGLTMPLKKHRNEKNSKTHMKMTGSQMAIVKGDKKSFSIAAASIVAKVTRDRIMERLSKDSKYSVYGWERNKGYGTLFHRNAIQKYGATKLHRKDYID
jgi:ribonuclease HII